MGSPHILVVEDDQAIQRMLDDVLTAQGYSVAVVTSGSAALSEMQVQRPDVILLDLVLPEMTGWTFLATREHDPVLAGIPVLVVTAAEPAGLREAEQLGAPIILRKPFDLEELSTEVKRLCLGPVRQCAWCGGVSDASGAFRLHSGRKLRWATHGICPRCKEIQRQQLLN